MASGIVVWDQQGLARGLDRCVPRDLKVVVESAARHKVALLPTLLDFLVADGVRERRYGEKVWEEGEHPEILTEPKARQAFVDNVVVPVARELVALDAGVGGKTIWGFDLLNEPENASRLGSLAAFTELKQFVKQASLGVRTVWPDGRLFVGSRNRIDLADFWNDVPLERQFHWYDDMATAMDYLKTSPEIDVFERKRVLVGEVEPTNVHESLDRLARRLRRRAVLVSLRRGRVRSAAS